jgi:hypothetical protein
LNVANYRVAVAVSTIKDGYTTTIQLPLFVLEGDVLGILHEAHAETLARSIFEQLAPGAGVAASAVELS